MVNSMSKIRPELAFVGYSTIDVIHTPRSSTTRPGGGAYFASLSASRLVKSVGLISAVGADYNLSCLMNRIDTEGIRLVSSENTARSTLTYHSQSDLTDRDISIEWGASKLLEGKDIPREWFPGLKMIHVATMVPAQQHEIIQYIKKNSPATKISLDTDSFLMQEKENLDILNENFQLSDIVFVNRVEYGILSEFIDRLSQVIVKLDKDGAYYMTSGKILARSKAKKVETVDVTGAGDVFAGAFLSSLHLGYSIQNALDYATSLASYSITKVGIQHLFETRL